MNLIFGHGSRLATALLLGLCAGCSDETPPRPPGFLESWAAAEGVDVDDTPSAEALLGSLGGTESFSADFSKNETDGAWSFVGTRAQPKLRRGALRIRATADTRAIWEVPIDAASTTHLAVKLAATPNKSASKYLRVYWQPADTDEFVLDPGHSASVPYADAGGQEVLIPVGRQPSWSGQIRALAFAFRIEENVDLVSVRGLDLAPAVASWLSSIAPEKAEQTAVEIQRMRLRALRVANPSELSQRLRVEAGTSLAFSFAVHPLSAFLPTSRTRFEVLVRDGDTTELLGSFETPSEEYPRLAGWHPVVVPLGPFAGREVEILLRTEPAAAGAATGLPLWGDPRIRRAAPANSGPNLLLISVDTLRADHLESYGYQNQTAPGIAQLAREGALFENCLSHAPSTLPSHGSLLTGIPSHANRFYGPGGNRLPASRETLAERLRKSGLATAAFAGGGFFDPHYGLDQGFDAYSYAKTGTQALDYSDLDFNVSRALTWLQSNADRRFFLFLHTYEVHGPFQPRAEFIDDYLPEGVRAPDGTSDMTTNARGVPLEAPDFEGWREYVTAPGEPEDFHPHAMERIVASYDSEIRQTDRYLTRILETLKELGVEENTLIVFTSDHGEAFLEHGRIGHGHLYEDNLRVPLILRMPGTIPAGTVLSTRVQLADVLPTCLEALGIEAPVESRGISLLPMMTRKAGVPHRAIVSYGDASGISYVAPSGKKLIVNLLAHHPRAGQWEIYDLDSDPQELHDLSGALAPEERTTFEARVAEALSELPGTHLVLRPDAPAAFEGSLELRDSHSGLARQLRMFPLESDWLRFAEDGTLALTTTPQKRLWFHAHQGEGSLHLQGVLRLEDGSSAPVDMTVPVAELSDGPRSMEILTEDGRRIATLVALAVGIEGDADGADGPSVETLDQLRDLGYL